MTRDDLVWRSLVALTVLVAGASLLDVVLPSLRPLLGYGLAYLALFGIGLGLAWAGRPRAGAVWVLVAGGVGLAALLQRTGGIHGRHAAYVPMLGAIAWAWLGPRWAVPTLAVSLGALAATSAATPVERGNESVGTVVALLTACSFAGAVVARLRWAGDLAARRALQAAVAARRAAIDEQARDRFLATVSHELRTPLDTVLGYTDLLREDEPDPARRADLDRIRESGGQLASLVDDLLDMSRTDGDLELAFTPVSVAEVVAEVERTAAPLVARGGNTLRVDVAAGLPRVTTDGRRVRQILLNLLSNASKYTSDGEIVLSVHPAGPDLRLSVTDTGLGIPAERLPELFRPFVQLHEGPDRRPGIGLGLALSQRLALRLGGSIDVTSEPGRGSTFALRLPVERPASGSGAPSAGSTAAAAVR